MLILIVAAGQKDRRCLSAWNKMATLTAAHQAGRREEALFSEGSSEQNSSPNVHFFHFYQHCEFQKLQKNKAQRFQTFPAIDQNLSPFKSCPLLLEICLARVQRLNQMVNEPKNQNCELEEVKALCRAAVAESTQFYNMFHM